MASRISVLTFSLLAAAVASILTAETAWAQYKWLGSDDRINYSDRPPPPDHKRLLRGPSGAQAAAAPASEGPALPYALRTAVERYPVTLYTTAECPPCQEGRELLTKRGVPFSEKRVRSAGDAKQFATLGFEEARFPSVSIGRDKMVGFESGAWHRMLDAAGYPKSSMLPPNYAARNADALTADEPSAPPRRGARAQRQEDAAADSSRTDELLTPATMNNDPRAIRF